MKKYFCVSLISFILLTSLLTSGCAQRKTYNTPKESFLAWKEAVLDCDADEFWDLISPKEKTEIINELQENKKELKDKPEVLKKMFLSMYDMDEEDFMSEDCVSLFKIYVENLLQMIFAAPMPDMYELEMEKWLNLNEFDKIEIKTKGDKATATLLFPLGNVTFQKDVTFVKKGGKWYFKYSSLR